MLLAFTLPLFNELVQALGQVLIFIHHLIPSYGWALIVLALAVRVVMWPLSEIQFRSMAEMQKVQPLVKQLQAKYKSDPQVLNQQMMALYKEHNVNPLAGCVPMLIQMPILIGLFWAIQNQIGQFRNEHWLWIGSPISQQFPHFFATSLAVPDIFLLGLYVVSMYFTIRYGSPPSQDPQQAQTQKIMAFLSPAMIAFFGFRGQWASALYVYWLATNVFTVAQQFWMYRRYGLIGPKAKANAAAMAAAEPVAAVAPLSNRAKQRSLKSGNGVSSSNGKRTAGPKKRARR